MGGSSLLTSFALVAGLAPSLGALFIMLTTSLISFNATIMLGRSLGRNFYFCILFGAIFSMSSLSLDYTSWSFSYRGLFLCLMPIFLYLLVEIINSVFTNRSSINLGISLFLAASVIFALVSIHRVSFFLPMIILTSLLFVPLYRIYHLSIHRFSFSYSRHLLVVITVLLYLIPLFSSSSYFKQGEYSDYGINVININFLNVAINTSLAYVIGLGLPGLFVIPGLVYVYFYTRLSNVNNFIIIILVLSFFPYWIDTTYAILYILLLLSYISASGIVFIFNHRKLKPNSFLIPILLVILIVAPNFFVFIPSEPDNLYLSWTKEEEIPKAGNTGTYLSHQSNIGLISDGSVSMSKIAAFGPYDENLSIGRSGIAPYFVDFFTIVN